VAIYLAIGINVTDTSSTAVLPQLTDLLRALTDSQELLLLRVRSVRHLSTVPLVVEEDPKLKPLQSVDLLLPAPVAATTATTKDEQRADPVDQIESSTGAHRLTLSEPDMNSSLAATTTSQVTYQETPVSTHAATEMFVSPREADVALPTQAPTAPESGSIRHVDATDANSVNRNYNFFDELDAKLARLEDQQSESAEL